MSLIGIHAIDIKDIINIYKKYNILFFQIFVSPNIDYDDDLHKKIIENIKKNGITIVVHASYCINLSKKWKSSDLHIQQLISEIQICDKINSFGIVLHTGKQLDLSEPEALNNMYTALIFVHTETIKYKNVKILIETPSGQGTETLITIKELCRFMNKFFKHPNQDISNRFGICIDTCHIYASGYNIAKKNIMNYFFSIIDTDIGIDKIKLCHLNDSKGSLGSRIDRHESIGNGKIGKKAILNIFKFMNEIQIPIILETPDVYNNYNILHNYVHS